MKCPQCGRITKVVGNKAGEGIVGTYRMRRCCSSKCSKDRFSTVEVSRETWDEVIEGCKTAEAAIRWFAEQKKGPTWASSLKQALDRGEREEYGTSAFL